MTKPWKRRKYIKLNNDKYIKLNNDKYIKLNNDKYSDIQMNTTTILNDNSKLMLPIQNRRNGNYLKFINPLTIIENTKLILPIQNKRNYKNDTETICKNNQDTETICKNNQETETTCKNNQETYCFHISSPKLYMRDLTQNDLYFLEHYKYQGINAHLRNQHVVVNHYNTQKLVLWSPDF